MYLLAGIVFSVALFIVFYLLSITKKQSGNIRQRKQNIMDRRREWGEEETSGRQPPADQ